MKRGPKQQPEAKLPGRLRAWGLSMMALLALTAGVVWGIGQLRDPQVMPIRVVGIDGDIHYLQRVTL